MKILIQNGYVIDPESKREEYMDVLIENGATPTEQQHKREYGNIDFFENGAMVIQAGGKNQVGKKYLKLLEEVKLPIKILLDNDAEEIRKILEEKLRKEDKLCLIKIGEFEDIIPLELIIDALNENFKYELKEKIKKSEFAEKNTKALSEIYRTRGLGDFKKAEFAHLIEKYVEISKKAYNFDDLNKNILSVIKI